MIGVFCGKTRGSWSHQDERGLTYVLDSSFIYTTLDVTCGIASVSQSLQKYTDWSHLESYRSEKG